MAALDDLTCTVCDNADDWMTTRYELPGFRPFRVYAELCGRCAATYLHSPFNRLHLHALLLIKLATLTRDALLGTDWASCTVGQVTLDDTSLVGTQWEGSQWDV